MTRYYINNEMIAIRAASKIDGRVCAAMKMFPDMAGLLFGPDDHVVVSDVGERYSVNEFIELLKTYPEITDEDYEKRFGKDWRRIQLTVEL